MRGKKAKAIRKIAYIIYQRPQVQPEQKGTRPLIVHGVLWTGLFYWRRRVGVRCVIHALKKLTRPVLGSSPLVKPVKLAEWKTRKSGSVPV